MRTEDELRVRIYELAKEIYKELETGTNDPVKQWALLKAIHAQQAALEWALEDQEVS